MASQFDGDRLADLGLYLEDQVDQGTLPGVALLLTRGNEIILDLAYGHADREADLPIEPDTIFSLYSMTKPLAAVAMLLLLQEDDGAWSLDDAVDQHLPELAGMLGLPDNVATRMPTWRETFTHTAGFDFGRTPELMVATLMRLDFASSGSLAEHIGRLATMPFTFEPGTEWSYSVATDLQVALVERASGRRFDLFLRDHLFEPLGMIDTGFALSYEQHRRRARGYVLDATTGQLRPASPPERLESIFPMGGTSLFSTARDYLRFAQMLLGRGALGDVTVLRPALVDLLFANHLPGDLMARDTLLPPYVIGGGNGFGLNGLVCVDPAVAGRPVGRGTYEWGGAFGTFFWVDPEHDIACVGMTSRARVQEPRPLEVVAQEIVYDAFRPS